MNEDRPQERRPDERSEAVGRATMGNGRKFHPVYLCLLVPFVALLWVPFYDRLDPELFGIPFFYWYQMAWTLLGAVFTLPVYLYEERTRQKGNGK